MTQMKEQNKTPEKELNKTDIANLSDAKFKTMVIVWLREMTECSNNIKEKMKVTLSEIKKNLPLGEGRKLGVKSTNWNIRKKQAFN